MLHQPGVSAPAAAVRTVPLVTLIVVVTATGSTTPATESLTLLITVVHASRWFVFVPT